MTSKKKIIIFLVAMCLLLVSVFMRAGLLDFALSPVAKIYNDKQLAEMKKEILEDLDLDEKYIKDIEVHINGEIYAMIGKTSVNERLASCFYSVDIEFSKDNFLTDEELYYLANTFKINNKQNLKVNYRSKNEHTDGWISFNKKTSIPLGSHNYVIGTKGGDSMSVLIPEKVFYPLPLYDSRCRTILEHNGA